MARTKTRPVTDAGSAWALAVVSSEGQAETLQHQRKWAHDVAKGQGWRLARVIEGVASGKAGPRKLVRDLLVDLRALEADSRPGFLLMIRIDRLGRGSVIESQIVLRDIIALGVKIFTRDDGFVALDSATDELISAAKLAVARIENDVRSDKVLAVIHGKRERGEAFGRTPYGLIRSGKADVIDPDRAQVVREAFKMRLAGAGLEAIGKRLSAIAPPQKLKNKTTKHPTGEWTVHWTAHRVSLLLSNRGYVGPIIDEATFVRAQKVAATLTNAPRLDERKRRFEWPLGGALHCFCGSSMSGLPCGTEPWRYRYYCCRSRWNHDGKMRLVRAEKLEDQFVALLGRLRASGALAERYRKRAVASASPRMLERSLKQLTENLTEVDRRRNLAFELHAQGRVRADDVQERLDRLAGERQTVQQQIGDVRDQLTVAKEVSKGDQDADALFRRAPQIFAKAKESDKRAIARAVALTLGGFRVDEKGALKMGVR
jgi:DNA invertase Pin-like site-specific DNA recombinase